MNKYEVLYIIDIDTAEEQKAVLVDKFAGVITSLGGTVENIDNWGAKRLAYPINRKNEGFYVLMNFDADPSVPEELTRQMHITDGIVRHMIVKK